MHIHTAPVSRDRKEGPHGAHRDPWGTCGEFLHFRDLGNYEIHKLKWSRLNSEKKKLLLRLVLYDYSLAFSSRYQTFTRKDSNFKAEKDLKSAKISIFFIEDWRVLIQTFKNIGISPFNKKNICMHGFHAPGSFSKNRSDV